MTLNLAVFFALGRNAMYAGCRLLGLREGDEVLAPAWICDSALEPYRALGCKIVFYRIDPYTFQVDVHHIQKLITPRTRLLHVVQHFGQPLLWNEIWAIREQFGLPILEDNAYSLFSSVEGREFGSFGDIAIFSLRKNLPLPDGGMLRVNGDLQIINHKARVPWIYSVDKDRLRYFVSSYIKMLLGINISLRSLLGKRCPKSSYPPPLYSDGGKRPPPWPRGGLSPEFSCNFERPMSKLSMHFLRFFSHKGFSEMAFRKRGLYGMLVNDLMDLKGIRILHPDLKDGAVPYCLFLLVEKNRDRLLYQLQERCYPVMAWPTLPLEVIANLDKYPDVELLGRKGLQINLVIDLPQKKYFQLASDLKIY